MTAEQEASLKNVQNQFDNVTVGLSTINGLSLVYYAETSSIGSLPEHFGVLLSSPKAAFTFFGKAYVSYIYGAPMECMGAEISMKSPGPHAIFSPSTHAPLAFRQRVTNMTSDGDDDVLSPFNPSRLETTLRSLFSSDTTSYNCFIELVTGQHGMMGDNCSVLLFRPFVCRVSDSLQNVKRFGNLYSLTPGNILPRPVSQKLGFNFTEGDATGFRSSVEMSILADKYVYNISKDSSDDTTKPTRLLLAGPKSAGKSSLLRFLVNRLLTQFSNRRIPPRIAVLDCDVGQPEFTPCGMVSLTIISRPIFGPPFTHHVTKSHNLICQCFVGTVTPSENPNFYLKCLEYVYQAYLNLPTPRPPLIVNTMGWTQGLGMALLVEQIVLTKPDLVAQIQLNPKQFGARQNLPILDAPTLRSMHGWNSRDLSTEPFNHEVFILPSVAHLATDRLHSRYGAPDHRDLTLLAYEAP
ncbi:Protein grc3 [Fasciola gigantica]|uniref:Protein grc3 n=1 Tax=Fasciola gigantica TaxID=46835 RepID=A0A504YP56_FASGI|nr:Protein grc3 [Fasciola gigantica]